GVGESLGGGLRERRVKLLRERLGTEQAILLLDAFDEVPVERRAVLRQALHDWVPGTPQARLLFTSRVVGYEPPWPIAGRSETEREMELLPFDDAQTGAFMDAFFAGEPGAGRELRELLRRGAPPRGGGGGGAAGGGFLWGGPRGGEEAPPGGAGAGAGAGGGAGSGGGGAGGGPGGVGGAGTGWTPNWSCGRAGLSACPPQARSSSPAASCGGRRGPPMPACILARP